MSEPTIHEVSDVPTLPRRARDGHKGLFGRLLVVGGSRGMIGAPALTATAALRSGAGLVTMALPECIQTHAATLQPCATSVPCPCSGGSWDASAVETVHQAASRNDVVAIGPGFDMGDGQQAILRAMLQRDQPIVIDADGLNNLAQMTDWPTLRRCPLILTPHPGELGRLTGESVGDIQNARKDACARWARWWSDAGQTDAPLVVVLKGSGTVVSNGRRR